MHWKYAHSTIPKSHPPGSASDGAPADPAQKTKSWSNLSTLNTQAAGSRIGAGSLPVEIRADGTAPLALRPHPSRSPSSQIFERQVQDFNLYMLPSGASPTASRSTSRKQSLAVSGLGSGDDSESGSRLLRRNLSMFIPQHHTAAEYVAPNLDSAVELCYEPGHLHAAGTPHPASPNPAGSPASAGSPPDSPVAFFGEGVAATAPHHPPLSRTHSIVSESLMRSMSATLARDACSRQPTACSFGDEASVGGGAVLGASPLRSLDFMSYADVLEDEQRSELTMEL